jgi:hypothetical protein
MQTNSNLQNIHQKVDEIESGLLRFQHDDSQVTLHVKAKGDGKNLIYCDLTDKADYKKIVPGKVSLIQKSDKNYLYIAGEIEKQSPGNKQPVSIRIIRACWFILKSKGSVSWLQEKYIYDRSEVNELELAS